MPNLSGILSLRRGAQVTNSRAKGARGELLARNYLRWLGIDCHRSQQYCGRAGDSDVTLEVGSCSVEVKFGYNDADLAGKIVAGWISKAQHDAAGKPWFILWKPSRKAWRVIAPRMGVVGVFVGDDAEVVVRQAVETK